MLPFYNPRSSRKSCLSFYLEFFRFLWCLNEVLLDRMGTPQMWGNSQVEVNGVGHEGIHLRQSKGDRSLFNTL